MPNAGNTQRRYHRLTLSDDDAAMVNRLAGTRFEAWIKARVLQCKRKFWKKVWKNFDKNRRRSGNARAEKN
jgi:hypothetical protein